ncbi:protein FAR1-RELATED SEQUENCE 5-like [Arachis stenosperma]|uniref:protein FAR1-RELATED SEQUENCE 5-like n=1 Tax=Arachis stenosperma TaxID=217475 RepID=UPI0025ABA2FF|nr:protein FAR1-RELATED SEQUENCE 5-like [Arachis stenosperma]
MECYGGMGKANGLSADESENEICVSNNNVVDENDLRKAELLSDEDGREYGYMTGLSAEDIMKKVFRSEEHAYEFYGRLGKCNGFGVRKGDYAKNEDGSVVRRRFFCNRAGLRDGKHYNRLDRKRCHRPETRTNCQALMSVYLDKGSSVWKVRKVILEHNHELIPTGMVHMIRSFRVISDSAKAHMDGMHTYGFPTSKILGYMAGIAGGYSSLGFTKKDAYNYMDRSKRAKVVDGDMNAAIVYLEGKAAADPMSMARYNLNEEGMLGNMFWADGPSRVDFQHFGDVVAFDSTYKKNKYNRPLVIFLGSNNHKQTTIFGFGLVLDETIGSYKWMLENLLEVMCGKLPSVVVTDGDESMIAAVREVLPQATHRLCAWHLQKNVTSNSNEQMFRDVFAKWLYADMEVEEFECEWAQVAEQFGLLNKYWALQLYEKRKMWANAYLRRKFCAGFRTTSRCEGINSHLKKFLSSRHTILELVQNLELLVREYRNNELVAQFSSIYGVPVLTTRLDPIEHFAASVYTKVIFTEVKKEIESISIVNFVSKRRVSTTMVYTVEEYGFPGQNVVAMYDPKRGRLVCRCGFWEKEGFPCRHMFFVMKHEHVKRIPESLILRRWRKDVKTVNEYTEKTGLEDERGFLLRHGALHAASQWMLFVGSKNDDLYKKCMSGIRQICYDLEARSGNDTMDRSQNAAGAVRDPSVVRTKGAPSTRGHKGKKRKCTRCRKTGHTKRRCTEPQKMSTSTRYKQCPKKETTVSKLEVGSPHFDVHADQGKRLEEGDHCRSEQDGGANEKWEHVIGTAQSQTRNMRGVGNTVDWNIENMLCGGYCVWEFLDLLFDGAVCIMSLLVWNLQNSWMFFVLGVGNIALVTRSLLKVWSTWCSLYGWTNVLYVTNLLRVLTFLCLYSVNVADARNCAAASKLE